MAAYRNRSTRGIMWKAGYNIAYKFHHQDPFNLTPLNFFLLIRETGNPLVRD